MKPQLYKIRIPEPCHEKWGAMTPNEKGRFCQACAKTVVDFSTWADEDILKYLQTAKGGTCGRLSQTQLSRTYKRTTFFEKHIYKKLLKAAAFIILFLRLKKADAQVGKVRLQPNKSCQPEITQVIIATKGELHITQPVIKEPITDTPATLPNENMVDGGMSVIPVEEVIVSRTGDTVINAVDTNAGYEYVKNADGVLVKVKKETAPPFSFPVIEPPIYYGGVMIYEPFWNPEILISGFSVTTAIAGYDSIHEVHLIPEERTETIDNPMRLNLPVKAPESPTPAKKIPEEAQEKLKAVMANTENKVKKGPKR